MRMKMTSEGLTIEWVAADVSSKERLELFRSHRGTRTAPSGSAVVSGNGDRRRKKLRRGVSGS